MKYYLALNYDLENWKLKPFDSTECYHTIIGKQIKGSLNES